MRILYYSLVVCTYIYILIIVINHVMRCYWREKWLWWYFEKSRFWLASVSIGVCYYRYIDYTSTSFPNPLACDIFGLPTKSSQRLVQAKLSFVLFRNEWATMTTPEEQRRTICVTAIGYHTTTVDRINTFLSDSIPTCFDDDVYCAQHNAISNRYLIHR